MKQQYGLVPLYSMHSSGSLDENSVVKTNVYKEQYWERPGVYLQSSCELPGRDKRNELCDTRGIYWHIELYTSHEFWPF